MVIALCGSKSTYLTKMCYWEDIFVKSNPDDKSFMSIVAQSSKNPKQNYEVWVHHFMQKAPVLKEALLGAMEKFKQKFDKIL